MTSLESELKKTLRKFVDGYNLGVTFISQTKLSQKNQKGKYK